MSLIAVLITYLFKVLKPFSAECHVVMDQSSEIVLDTPKVFKKSANFCFEKLPITGRKPLFIIFQNFFFFTASD